MIGRPFVRVVFRLVAGAIALGSIACANSPGAPSPARDIPATSWAEVTYGAATTSLAQCLAGIPIFDRTTTGLIIRGGYVETPTPFDLPEIDFPTIVAPSATATSVVGTYRRPTVGGDSPQQPSASTGTLTCNWSLAYR